MKKVLTAAFLTVLSAFFLCSCKGYREADNGYIVTAVGFGGGKEVTVFAEVVTAGGTERSDAPVSEVIEGSGKTPIEAVFSLNNQISKHLAFEHCTAIIIDKTITSKQFDKILEYAKELKELNFAVDMFFCDDVKTLLNESESVSVARGFDISGNLTETNKETGIDYKNKFYEIYNKVKDGSNYAFPLLKLKDGKVIIDGQIVFNGKKECARLSNAESLIYSFVSDGNDGGRVCIKNEFADVSRSDIKLKKGIYELGIYIKKSSKGFREELKTETENFLRKYKTALGLKSEKIEIHEREGI